MKAKWIPILGLLLGGQLALALALDLRSDRLAPSQPDSPLVAADLGQTDDLRIDGPLSPGQAAQPGQPAAIATDEHIELVKQGNGWVMPGHFGAPANAAKIDALLKQLQQLRRGYAIATTVDAAQRFAVAEHHYERRLVAKAGSKLLATIYLGNSPGLRKSDARSAGQHVIYAVDLATYEVPAGADAWLDQSLLDHDAAAPVEIDVSAAGQPTLALKRVGSAWKAADLPSGRRLDAGQAAALASTIADLRVDSLLGQQPKPEWHQDRPALVLTMKDKKGKTVSWTFSKAEQSDKLVLKSSDHSWYLQLDALNARPLLDMALPARLLVASAKASAATAATPASPARAASAAAATRHALR